jgi:MerR family transcriptional regulator, copper efflux regulator
MIERGTIAIGAAARAAGVSVKMVRHYEEIGLLPRAVRGTGGSRRFGESDIHTLRFVARARSLGFPLGTIRKLLSLWQDPNRSNAETLRLAEEHMAEMLAKTETLTAMTAALRHLMDACAGDGRPDCPILDEFAARAPASVRREKAAR